MITIQIGSSALPLPQADPNWVAEQLRRRRQDGQSVCVRVTVDVRPDISIQLSTVNCPRGNGVVRSLSSREQMIFDLWEKHHLDNPEIEPGNLISFLRQLGRLVD